MKRRTGAVGLTGGIACGKSTVAALWQADGVPVLDTDVVARAVLSPGHPVFNAVIEAFGRSYLQTDGGIDRHKLGGAVFADAAARARLNALMHPAIFAEVERWLDDVLTGSRHAVVVVPLLFETGADALMEKTVTVASDEVLVRARLAARGLDESAATARLDAQWPLVEKVRRADAVIWNNGTIEALGEAARAVWRTTILGKEHAKT
jgi:dephospho-CoA kinase